jgi:hypothetical protein
MANMGVRDMSIDIQLLINKRDGIYPCTVGKKRFPTVFLL